ncbi:MAG: hypothetical protein IPN94_24565 [Sphingobacteriales bacterium]|nr:hypothetical protein [Sphingobacteriales bacterium]
MITTAMPLSSPKTYLLFVLIHTMFFQAIQVSLLPVLISPQKRLSSPKTVITLMQ